MKEKEITAVSEKLWTETAKALLEQNPGGFKLWALGLAGATPVKKHGKIDGIMEFIENDKSSHKILVQVKGDEELAPGMIIELAEIVDKEEAAIGLIINLQKPRLSIITESVHAGCYDSPLWKRQFLKIQIRTVTELLQGKTFEIPQTSRPARKKKKESSAGTPHLM
jgi:hypothetical protein